MMVLSIIQNSMKPSILEAYSYCETTKDLWDTLQKVYVNMYCLIQKWFMCLKLKKAINTLSQEDMEFTKCLRKFRSL
ncbi:hypothetical protein YC2023_117433 [Brassica napus]|uniref:Uncharacterized protein n=1 Tax=Brassica oleracea TaxID=3712 RepID=A0A3P6EJT1_BRAOL|nr:unnamed protein product [Brassica oleracea]